MRMKSLLCLAVAAGFAAAQQANSNGASMKVDGNDGFTYPIVGVPVRTNTTSDILVEGFPNSPFLIALSATGVVQPFSAPLYGDKLDLPFNPPNPIWFNGFWGTGIANFKTDVLGDKTIVVSIPAAMPINGTVAFQALVTDPSSPFGLSLSAATQTITTQGPTITNHSLGDLGTASITLTGWNIPFYGTNYTSVHTNADGYMTFGSSWSGFSSDPGQMTSRPPGISGFWADLDQSAGVIRSTVDANPPFEDGYVQFEFISVIDWSGVGYNHTFSWKVNKIGNVEITSAFTNNLSIFETLVGIAPGNGINIGTMLNLNNIQDTPPNFKTGAVNEQFYEWFGQTTMPSYTLNINNPYDLIGRTLFFYPNYTPPPSAPPPTIADTTKSYVMF